ncbi:MAG: T9SS type A sorting domain-containing protein [Bacteroidales bacterium]|nr:T9SS type A sorting domain-containing protein [Bacteroidales bacterium]
MKTTKLYPVLIILQLLIHTGMFAAVRQISTPGNNTDFLLTIRNIAQTAGNELQFDIYLEDTDPSQTLELASIQFGINFNTQILNGAPQEVNMTSIVPGSSQLPAGMQPISVNSAIAGQIRVPGRIPPGAGNGFIVPTLSPGIRIITLRITNPVNFTEGTTPDFAFSPSTAITPAYATRVAIYLNGLNTQLPVVPGTNAIVTENPVLNIGNGQLPHAYEVTGGGFYCEGDQSSPVTLAYSQSGVVYELFRDNVTTNLTINGTGYLISFGSQPDGVYTITGTNENGTTQMTGSTTVAEASRPSVSISVNQDTLCHGSYAIFTADVTFSGDVTYHWFRNNAPTGSNSPTLTLWAVDGDDVWLRVTSAQGCSAVSDTIGLRVFINYAEIAFDIYDPIQLVAGEEITLESYPYNAGLNPSFEWFVNDVQVPGNDCQLTYTPGPADEVYVRMIPSGEVPCLQDAYYSNTVKIYTCTAPPQAFDVWAETNTCGGEMFSFGLSDTEPGVHYFVVTKYEGDFNNTLWDFYGTGEPIEEYGVQSGDYYYLAVNACESTWMNGHANLYPFDTRATVLVSENNICNGEEVVFNAKSNQSESVICTYNWVINGSWEWNPKPGDFNYTPSNGDLITARMATPCQHDDLHFPDNNRILMMVNNCPDVSTTWNGNISENWHEQANWNNGIPGTNTIAIIPGGMTNYPTITNTARCRSIIIENGGSFIGGEYLEAQSALVKCIFSDAEYHFLSSPVNPNPVFGEVFRDNQNTIWARKYNERNGEWINLTRYDQFEKAKGYSMQLTQPNMAQFIGQLNGENASAFIENYNTSGIEDRAGWNLLGNPFPSSIDWDLIPHTNIENAVYVWDGTQYISWNGSVGALTNGIIPPMNGFFVKMTADYWYNFMIPAVARVHGNTPFYKERPSDLLEFRVTGDKYSDVTFLHFSGDATPAFDPESDARKLAGIEEAPQLFSYAEEKELSINVKPFSADETTDLGFRCGLEGQFSMHVNISHGFCSGTDVLMEDLALGTLHNLSDDPDFSFSYKTGDPEQRFRLILATDSNHQANGLISLYCSGRKLYIKNKTGLPLEIKLYDLSGKLVSKMNNFYEDVYLLPSHLSAGLYIVQCHNSIAATIGKIILR